MEYPEPALPETSARQCPSCQSQDVVHEGHVIGGGGMLKTAQRCEMCHAMFWFVRRRAPVAAIP